MPFGHLDPMRAGGSTFAALHGHHDLGVARTRSRSRGAGRRASRERWSTEGEASTWEPSSRGRRHRSPRPAEVAARVNARGRCGESQRQGSSRVSVSSGTLTRRRSRVVPRWAVDRWRSRRVADRLSPLDATLPVRRGADHTDARRRAWRSSRSPRTASTTTGSSTLIRERIAFVPRYRQRIREVPGRLANPVWVDDENFDIGLPRPALGAARRAPTRSCASWWRGSRAGRWTEPAAVGDVPRRGARGRPLRDHHQDPPGDGRRRRRGGHRPGHPRHEPDSGGTDPRAPARCLAAEPEPIVGRADRGRGGPRPYAGRPAAVDTVRSGMSGGAPSSVGRLAGGAGGAVRRRRARPRDPHRTARSTR